MSIQQTPIFALVKKKTGWLSLSCVLATIASLLTLVPYIIAHRFMFMIFGQHTTQLSNEVLGLAAILIVSIILKHSTSVGSSLAAHSAAYAILHDLRLAIAEKSARLPLDFFNEHAHGRLKSIMRDDVERLEDAIAHTIPDMVSGIATPLLMIVALFFLNVPLTFVFLTLMPFLFLFYKKTMWTRKDLLKEYGGKIAEFNNLAIEFVRGIKELRSFGADISATQRLTTTIDAIAHILQRSEQITLKPWSMFLTLVRGGALIGITLMGGYLYLTHSLDAATFAFFILIALVFTQPLLTLVYTAGPLFWKLSLSSRNIAWLMNAAELTEPTIPQIPEGTTIVFNDVNVRQKGKDILTSINLTIKSGTITAFIGPSGAGKTTLTRLIARSMDPDSGSVEIGGVDIKNISEETLFNHVGILFQDTFLCDDTIYNNILMGCPHASDEDVFQAALHAQVMEFAHTLPQGLQTRVGDNGCLLSGGQRQRIAIARLILKNAPIILLDEATSSLDPDCELLVQRAINALAKDRTVVVIAHRLHTIRDADQIIFMQAGKIEASGRHEHLMTYGPYASFWEDHMSEKTILCPAPCVLVHATTFGHDRPDLKALVPANDPLPAKTSKEKPLAFYHSLTSLKDHLKSGIRAAIRDGKAFLALSGPSRGTILSHALPLLSTEILVSSTLIGLSISILLLVAHDSLTSQTLFFISLLLIGVSLISGILTYISQKCLLRIHRLSLSHVQKSIIEKLSTLPLSFFDTHGSGILNTLFSIHLFRLDFVAPLTQAVRSLFIPLFSALILMLINWQLGLLLLSTVPLFMALIFVTQQTYGKEWENVTECRQKANTLSIEFLFGLPVMRAYRLLRTRLSGFSAALENEKKANLSAARSLILQTILAPSILELGFVGVLIIGAHLFLLGHITADIFAIFTVVGLVFYRPMFEAIDLMKYTQHIAGAANAIHSIVSIPNMNEATSHTTLPADTALTFESVSFHYTREAAINQMSFTAAPGTLTAIVGPSGAGKSTLIALATRFYEVDRGCIRLGSHNLCHLDHRHICRLISIVFQNSFLQKNTIAENIRFGMPDATDDAIINAARMAHAHDFIISLPEGYHTVIGQGGLPLSGGERQRIGIARAILKNAPILLCDEPTASVDLKTEKSIRAVLRDMAKEKIVMIATHNMDIASEADSVLVLNKGVVTEWGSHSDLMRHEGHYSKLYTIYQTRYHWKIGSCEDFGAREQAHGDKSGIKIPIMA